MMYCKVIPPLLFLQALIDLVVNGLVHVPVLVKVLVLCVGREDSKNAAKSNSESQHL